MLHFVDRLKNSAYLFAFILGLNISGGGNHGIAVAQTWQNVPSKSGSSGTWQALSCDTTSNKTWQPLGCNPVTYTCPAGYTLSGQTCSMTVLSSAIPNYYCASGVLSGSNCVTSSSYAATPNYYCPSGGSLSGTTCTVSGSYGATGAYNCGVPGRPSCIGVIPTGQGCDNVLMRSYPAGTKFQVATIAGGLGCRVFLVQTVSYSCPSGGNLSGSACYTTSTYGASLGSYACLSGGLLSGASCTTTSQKAASISGYYCNTGLLSGAQCSTTVTVPATAN